MSGKREQWNSRIGFILATVGSAVGLGNVWRFPTVVVQSGGGAFVALFLLIVVVVGVPLIIAELTLGRAGKQNIVSTFSRLAPNTRWWFVGLFSLVTVFIIISFYSVIAGWAVIYFVGSVMGIFTGLDAAGLTQLNQQLISNPVIPVLGQAVFIFFTVLIVLLGVTGGIERISKIIMPGIVVILLILLGRTLSLEGAVEGVIWFFRPELGLINVNTALDAVGQVFFSFSLGMGAILTYGSYLTDEENIPQSAFLIGVADVGIAILMGLIVIPALFAFNIEPGVGPAIVFVTLPAIFNTLPWPVFWSSLFFLMLSFAAITSAVSLLEVAAAYIVDQRGWSRKAAAITMGVLIFVFGLPAVLSQGVLSNVVFLGRDILDFMDFVSSSFFLPISGLLIVIFLGWVWSTDKALLEIEKGSPGFYWGRAWSFLIRFVMPIAIFYIFITGIRG
ncbi:sodium-dependent transporter [Dethiobacter alkaliphilus]|uniref:sodium-dependent transporter n=1 Tax=Dethiobacter alkaliphilus TaxID=427926 RepID=UPI00222659DE|nr:sodium-dependent transporter [Dethiobacter alkaliphilus]MCW3489690.1 sodium-dependent transporter [Dethiobacter alkaliphilus]